MSDVDRTLLITVTDTRRAKLCNGGMRRSFREVGISWHEFLYNGVTVDELYKAYGEDHAIVNKVIKRKLEYVGRK